MALFHLVQKGYQSLGIYATIKSNRNAPKFNWKNLFFLTCYLMLFVTSMAYMLFEANMIGEIADSIFMCLTTLTCAVYFVASIYKITNILELIGEFEKFVEKSKFMNHIRNESIDNIEWMNKSVSSFRINKCHFDSHVRQKHWRNWENRQTDSLCFGLSDYAWYYCAVFTHNLNQLFRIWFGRWIILSTFSCDVRFEIFLLARRCSIPT